jgi:CRP-like cAMP-binding protein
MSKDLDSFLGFFDPLDLEWILAASEHKHLSAGEILYEDGGLSGGIYVVIEGELSVHRNGMRDPISMVKPGQFVGEISLLDSQPTVATVMAHSDAKVLWIGGTQLQARLTERPRFAARFYQALGMGHCFQTSY